MKWCRLLFWGNMALIPFYTRGFTSLLRKLWLMVNLSLYFPFYFHGAYSINLCSERTAWKEDSKTYSKALFRMDPNKLTFCKNKFLHFDNFFSLKLKVLRRQLISNDHPTRQFNNSDDKIKIPKGFWTQKNQNYSF